MIRKEKRFFESLMLLEKWQILETSVWCVSVTWKDSLFLRCLRLSLSRDFCFSSSSSFSRARMCSSKQISASSLSMSETDTNSFTLLYTSQKGLHFISSDWRSETVGLQPFLIFFYFLNKASNRKSRGAITLELPFILKWAPLCPNLSKGFSLHNADTFVRVEWVLGNHLDI